MIRPVLALAYLTFSVAAAWAQAPPITGEPQPGRVFCDQSVTYRIAGSATVPEPYRSFLGAWSDAAWDASTCAALIVENIDPDGTASIIYAYGPLGSSARVTGGTQFAFRPGIADLIGRMTTPSGQSYQSAFKKTL
jgi:hypothetical protein